MGQCSHALLGREELLLEKPEVWPASVLRVSPAVLGTGVTLKDHDTEFRAVCKVCGLAGGSSGLG